MEEGQGLLSLSPSASLPSEEADAPGAEGIDSNHSTQGFLEKLSAVCPLLAGCGSKGA